MGMQEEKASTSYNLSGWKSSFLIPLCAGSLLLPGIPQASSQEETDDAPWSVKTLVEYQQHLHPSLKAQDVYKLIYQAAFGVEHILVDSARVDSLLLQELQMVDSAMPGEPLIERISLGGGIVRINLRLFKHLNLSPSLLVKAMFRSAAETIPDTLMFYRMWNEFSSLVRFGLLEFSMNDVKEWSAKVARGAIEPVHHSAEYSIVNKPAYRVVRRDVLESVFGDLK